MKPTPISSLNGALFVHWILPFGTEGSVFGWEKWNVPPSLVKMVDCPTSTGTAGEALWMTSRETTTLVNASCDRYTILERYWPSDPNFLTAKADGWHVLYSPGMDWSSKVRRRLTSMPRSLDSKLSVWRSWWRKVKFEIESMRKLAFNVQLWPMAKLTRLIYHPPEEQRFCIRRDWIICTIPAGRCRKWFFRHVVCLFC